jgi:hypothetical protein
MLNLPLNFALPMMGGGLPAALEWPALGAVLAWLIVLCLLGASAGLLHEHKRLPSSPPIAHASEPLKVRFGLSRRHPSAAFFHSLTLAFWRLACSPSSYLSGLETFAFRRRCERERD